MSILTGGLGLTARTTISGEACEESSGSGGILYQAFTLNASTLLAKEVTVSGVIGEGSKVRVIINGFTPLKNLAVWPEGNFKVVDNSIVFDAVDLVGSPPPEGSTLLVSYFEPESEAVAVGDNPQIKASVKYYPSTDQLRIATWVHVNGQVATPITCTVTIKDYGVDKIIMSGITPDAEGICYASNIGIPLDVSGLFTVKISISTAARNYTQYVEMTVEPEQTSPSEIASELWNTSANDADVANTMGRLVNELHTYTTGTFIISFANKTLTVYNKDNVTPMYTYDLYDKNGTLATSNIYERIPRL